VREWLGDRTGAELLERRALEIRFQSLDRSSAVLSERQQLRMAEMLRFQLDRYLSLALARGRDAGEVYRYVLRWKGAVFTRQRQARFARRNPELKEAVAELQSVSTRLATLALATPDPSKAAVWRRQLEELTDRKERLERDLSAKSAAFRQSREPPDAERLRLLLPAGAALVDLLQYHHHAPSKEQKGRREFEERLIAFVARSDAPIARVELGPAAPIQQCVDRWRKALRGGPDAEQAGKRLRELVWDPLQTRLAGATTVLVSPDGPLARFPLAALPGTKPGSYLLEDVGLGVVPVPRMLFDLLAPAQGASHGKQPAGSLLAVGAVDYDGQPGEFDAKMLVRSAVRSGERMRWSRLEGTRQEALAVRESFLAAYPEGQVRLLGGGRATEEALRQQAPQYRFLHLATHGFFAPASLRSSLGPVYADPSRLARPDSGLFGRQGVASFHPGLLSGLVVTGANQPPRPGCDDGILTAQEVAELDLGHVELAVLSACETGLGETAGGEGVLGLQRAFQVAGTTSTVTSLWQVDDAGTQTLMTEFYRNLWEKRLGKLDALRQAQLAMLRRYDPAQRKLIPRGLQAVEPQSAERPAASCYYWAAFVLSGDWR
jgi:CHAT domain-containing protein